MFVIFDYQNKPWIAPADNIDRYDPIKLKDCFPSEEIPKDILEKYHMRYFRYDLPTRSEVFGFEAVYYAKQFLQEIIMPDLVLKELTECL